MKLNRYTIVIVCFISAISGALVTYLKMKSTLSETAQNVMVREYIGFAKSNIEYVHLIDKKDYCSARKLMIDNLSHLNNPTIESCSRNKNCWPTFQEEAQKLMPRIDELLYISKDSKNNSFCDSNNDIKSKFAN